MPIKVVETSIPEVKIIEGRRFYDERGFFTETYKEEDFMALGIPRFVQDNLSESKKGVIRGLHWQEDPFAQGKLVSCIAGSILDVAVDIRIGSNTFGQHIAVVLNSQDQRSLWVPQGFAHGFQALDDYTRVLYKVTNYWSKESERSINFNDEELSIEWHQIQKIVSSKDLEAPTLKNYLRNLDL